MASRNKRRPFEIGVGAGAKGPEMMSDTAAAFLGSNPTAASRRGSREQRQEAAVGVDVGSLRDMAINQMRSIEPMTVNPNQVENTGVEGERRTEVKKRGVGDALKNFQ